MKGAFFQKPLEFGLAVEGESWLQNETVRGALTIRNHANEAVPLDGVRVCLAYADFRAVKAKSPDAFEILGTQAVDAGASLPVKGEHRLDWSFALDTNCPITEKSSSLFLIYGREPTGDKMGQLQLQVAPNLIVQEFLKALTIQQRFVIKSQRSSKGWVEVKLDPPTAKNFSTVESLGMSFRIKKGEQLEVRYSFAMKKLPTAQPGVEVKKITRDYEQILGPDKYRLPSGRFHPEAMEAAIQDVMNQLASAPLLS